MAMAAAGGPREAALLLQFEVLNSLLIQGISAGLTSKNAKCLKSLGMWKRAVELGRIISRAIIKRDLHIPAWDILMNGAPQWGLAPMLPHIGAAEEIAVGHPHTVRFAVTAQNALVEVYKSCRDCLVSDHLKRVEHMNQLINNMNHFNSIVKFYLEDIKIGKYIPISDGEVFATLPPPLTASMVPAFTGAIPLSSSEAARFLNAPWRGGLRRRSRRSRRTVRRTRRHRY